MKAHVYSEREAWQLLVDCARAKGGDLPKMPDDYAVCWADDHIAKLENDARATTEKIKEAFGNTENLSHKDTRRLLAEVIIENMRLRAALSTGGDSNE